MQWHPQNQAFQQYQNTQQFQHFQQNPQYSQYQQAHSYHQPQPPQGQQHFQTSQYPCGSTQQNQHQVASHQNPHSQIFEAQGQVYQVQQYRQAQSDQQSPHTQPLQQSYIDYQQQYQTQTHGTPSHGYYQQLQQHQPTPTPGQQPTLATSQGCFNCGVSDHFAQVCPEPKRAVPAGALDPKRYANPLKRFRAGGTFSEKPSAPNPNFQFQGAPNCYSPATTTHSNNIQYQVPYTTANPAATASNHSPAQEQAWQQYWQWQAYQQSQPQQQYDVSQQQQQQQPANQSVVHDNNSQWSGQNPSHAAQYSASNHDPQQVFPHSQPMQAALVTKTTGYYGPQLNSMGAEAAAVQLDHSHQHVDSTHAGQLFSNVVADSNGANVPDDTEEDNLDSLDVPDIPRSLAPNGVGVHLSNATSSAPVSLISMPLPANFVVADALCPIPPPPPERAGRCESKYYRDATPAIICEHIRATKYWRDHQEDTVFLDGPVSDDLVPIDKVRQRLSERRSHVEVNDNVNGQSRSQSRSVSVRKDSIDVYSSLEKLERGIAEIKAKQAALMKKRALERGDRVSPSGSINGRSPLETQTPVKQENLGPQVKQEYNTVPQMQEIEKAVKSEQDTEDVLAALGVTGAPKPVTGVFPGPMQASITERGADMMHQYQNFFPDGTNLKPPAFRPHIPPPPPPPPPFDNASSPYVEHDETSLVEAGYANGHTFSNNAVDPSNGWSSEVRDGDIPSVMDLRKDLPSGRKRSFNNRQGSSSDDDDAHARRQEEDVTPKFKRRQPKVAPAYSRRW